MLFFRPDSIAVYDTNSGEMLWNKDHDEREKLGTLFITKDISGYITEEDSYCKFNMLHLYDTQSGAHIASLKVERWFDKKEIWAKGPFLFCRQHEKIYVFKVVGKEVKKCTIVFPFDYLLKTIGMNRFEFGYYYEFFKLLGFLGKTNVLIGNLALEKIMNPSKVKHVVFSLNLDAAIAARNDKEANRAFSIVPHLESVGHRCMQRFMPVYETDRSTDSVDIVGVMCQRYETNDSEDPLILDRKYFITKMELP